MCVNAAAIPMTLGVGCNGHTGLVMDAAVYDNVSTTAYASPTEPGIYAQHRPDDLEAA